MVRLDSHLVETHLGYDCFATESTPLSRFPPTSVATSRGPNPRLLQLPPPFLLSLRWHDDAYGAVGDQMLCFDGQALVSHRKAIGKQPPLQVRDRSRTPSCSPKASRSEASNRIGFEIPCSRA